MAQPEKEFDLIRRAIGLAERRPSTPKLERVAIALALVVLIGAVVATYWGGVRGEFLGDDHVLFDRSPLVEVAPSDDSPFASVPRWLPRAVTVLSLAADRALWDPLPAGFRATNVALHSVATLLLFWLFLRWTRRMQVSLIAALLFAVHPVHVEAVAVVGARGQILASIFVFLALIFHSRARVDVESEGAASRRTRSLALSVLFFVIGTFASPIALVVPLVIALADILGAGSPAPRAARLWSEWALFAIASLPSICVTLVLSPPTAPLNRWLAGRAVIESLVLLVFPFPLGVYRILGSSRGADPISILALLIVAGLIVGFYLLGKRLPRGPMPPIRDILDRARVHVHETGFHPSGQALMLLVLPLLAMAVFPPDAPGPDVPFALFDHWLYLPSAAACLLLALLVEWAASRAAARGRTAEQGVAGLATAVIVILFVLIATSHHKTFENDVTLYQAAIRDNPESVHARLQFARAAVAREKGDAAIKIVQPLSQARPEDAKIHLFMGNLYRDVRDLDSAEKEVHEALRLDAALAPAHLTLGLIERERGNIGKAEASYREALRLDEGFAEAHNNIGALLAAHGDPAEALTALKRAVELDPTHGDAAANLASFLLEQHLPNEALSVLRRGIAFSESNARLHYNLGVVLQSAGDHEAASRSYLDAIRLDPTYGRPRNNLAVLYSKEKRYEEAIELLKKVVELEPTNERAHFNLGIAYQSVGKPGPAADEFSAALRIRPDYAEASRALSELFNPTGTRP